jgi:hypothetical protein
MSIIRGRSTGLPYQRMKEPINLYRRPAIDAAYRVSVHLAKRFQRRRFFFKSANQKQELPMTAILVNGSGQNEQSLREDLP